MDAKEGTSVVVNVVGTIPRWRASRRRAARARGAGRGRGGDDDGRPRLEPVDAGVDVDGVRRDEREPEEEEVVEDVDWEAMMPLEKYARMTMLLLEECRHNFLKNAKITKSY